jgi:hypothetical protein
MHCVTGRLMRLRVDANQRRGCWMQNPVSLLHQVGFSIEEDADAPAGKHARRVTKRTTQAIAMLLLPVSLLMVSSVSCVLMPL